MPEEISKEEISKEEEIVKVTDKEDISKEEEKYDFKTHVEIKEYQVKAREVVRGSARHRSKFSNELAIIEDNNEILRAIEKLSDHVADIEKRVLELEGKKIAEQGAEFTSSK